ncbi:uncharacterized protein N7498_003021 [Penicillium cinerascens]|uniref:Uncharacterized protein n=1 Tax=Penicillium cinerascens TaxID=70096 RepID=A0A9W9NB77_9EURO|nr:uncharacterized protein N7498_003021 [Penicillium cinerascens]KAJ5216614.1 hypothetical protein N7498_003021 [Penicillium cinerascens]
MFCEHPDRILQRIVLLAPHVRQIALQISAFGERGPQEDFNETIKLKPQTEIKETPFPAKIESLSWPLNTKMTAEQFQELQKITDFSFLRSWTVGCIEDSTLLQTIVNIHPFRQLSRLTLALFQPEADDQGFWPAAESMFKSLPPLTYLCLLGAYAPNFLSGAVLCWHGPTLLELKVHKGSHTWTDQDLRRLSGKGQIGPIFSSQDILEVAGQCPSLRKLWICLQRYRGLESDVYAALGRFPCLVELDLVLNCVPEMGVNKMPITPRDLTEFEKGLIADRWNECLRWFTRDCMINCAIDETLAKAIFTHILANQDARRLLQLRIHPLYGQRKKYSYNGPGGRNRALHFDFEFLKLLAPTWTVKLEFLTGLRATKCVQPRLHPDRFQDDTLSIFKSIWTTEPDANTWPLDWHSWPLQSV